MHIQDIEHQIRESFMEIYGEQYIGKLKIEPLEEQGYCVTLGMQDTNLPITICAELDDQTFIQFFKQELKDKGLNRVKYGTLSSVEPSQYIDKSCYRKKN